MLLLTFIIRGGVILKIKTDGLWKNSTLQGEGGLDQSIKKNELFRLENFYAKAT